MSKALDYLHDWNAARARRGNDRATRESFITSNVSMAETSKNRYDIGMVIRIDTGAFYWGKTMWFTGILKSKKHSHHIHSPFFTIFHSPSRALDFLGAKTIVTIFKKSSWWISKSPHLNFSKLNLNAKLKIQTISSSSNNLLNLNVCKTFKFLRDFVKKDV